MAQTPKHDNKRDDDDDDRDERARTPASKAPIAQAGVLPQPEPAIGSAPLVGAIGVDGEHIPDGERDPHTVAEEQRRRSAEYEAHGFDLGQRNHDQADATRKPPPLQHQPQHDDRHTTKR